LADSNEKPKTDEEKRLLMMCLVKCADISNEIRPTIIAKGWAERVMTEFYAQVIALIS
jgi:high affinity cGMP-specific 3',5'-cyclic phosphodiesterase 9